MGARKAMTPAEQDNLLRGVTGQLLASAPTADWIKLRLVYAALVDFSAVRFETMSTRGHTEHRLPPRTILRELTTLREGMYLEGRGTWYTLHLEICHSGTYAVRYDYDGEPHFTQPRTDLSHALDHAHFPRTDEHVPDWLRLKLMGAEEETPGKTLAARHDPGPPEPPTPGVEWAAEVDPDRLRKSNITPGTMTPEETMDTIREIADHIFRALEPKGTWTGIHIDHKEVVGKADTRLTVDWTHTGPEPEWLPPEADRLLNKLRTGMYQHDQGTWFRANFRIEESGEIGIEFDQKNPPGFDQDIDPRCYLWDVHRFPRSSDHIPDWLLERLGRAQRMNKAERVPPRLV